MPELVQPRLDVAMAEVRAIPDSGARWEVTWIVHNQTAQPITLDAAWIPHGRFRGDGRTAVGRRILGGDDLHLTLAVTASEQPGTRVENAFLILRLTTPDNQQWRVFVRMSVEFDTTAAPRPRVETVTLQGPTGSADAR